MEAVAGSALVPYIRSRPMAPANRTLLAKSSFDLLRTLVFTLFVLRYVRRFFYTLKGHGPVGSLVLLYVALRKRAYGVFFRLPPVRSRIQKQLRDATIKMEGRLAYVPPELLRHTELPATGWAAEKVKEELQKHNEMKHTKWEDGYVSGAVYHGGKDLQDLQLDAFSKFTVSNPIHPDVFPGVRKMEAEVVAMVLNMFSAPPNGAGMTTSGGTESILMACLAARQKAFNERGVTAPEMVVPETAHTAFHKACEYFSIKKVIAPCPGPTHKVSTKHVSRLINPNTVLLIGSAPNFPHGIIDDITSLSRLAQRKSLPLHVDCCLGSFLVPHLAKAGFDTEPFDFRVPGVTSISCDTHKYGFAPKGNSTVLFRDAKLRSYAYFVSPDWSGGVYASPTMAGSRPGALIAGCWASMLAQGSEGYVTATHKIVGAAKEIEQRIREQQLLGTELQIIGKPLVSVVAFTATSLNIYDIADAMSAKGWHLNALQNPPAMHVAVTLPIVPQVGKLVDDLMDVVRSEREKEVERVKKGGKAKGGAKGDAAALYGVAGSLPNKSIVEDMVRLYLDTLYKA